MLLFLGTGIITADLKHAGTVESWSDRLKIEVRAGVSSLEQCLNVAGATPTGPAAFLVLSRQSRVLTSYSETVGAVPPSCVGKEGG